MDLPVCAAIGGRPFSISYLAGESIIQYSCLLTAASSYQNHLSYRPSFGYAYCLLLSLFPPPLRHDCSFELSAPFFTPLLGHPRSEHKHGTCSGSLELSFATTTTYQRHASYHRQPTFVTSESPSATSSNRFPSAYAQAIACHLRPTPFNTSTHQTIHNMKLTALCLFTAAYAAASTLASDLEPAAASPPSQSEDILPSPTILSAEEYAVLE
jgi:hypothetical protein